MSATPVPVDVVTGAGSSCPPATHILAELPHRPSAVPQARRVLRDCLGLADLPDVTCETAELLVSELVTNAVKYGRPPVWLLVELRPGLVHASVSDTSTVLPRTRSVDADAEGGRGLLVLDTLAGSWGAVPVVSGKYLWFDLPVLVSHCGGTPRSASSTSSASGSVSGSVPASASGSVPTLRSVGSSVDLHPAPTPFTKLRLVL